jgi:hypothetical protein
MGNGCGLSSPWHSKDKSVILLKIRDDDIRVLRIGATAKVHPDVQEFADLAAIVATTCGFSYESLSSSMVDFGIAARSANSWTSG